MSNFDMFKMAQLYQNAPDAVDKGLEQFKGFLEIENGMNRNFHDALTFKRSVDATNALNGWRAFNADWQKEKAAGQRDADLAAGMRMFDTETGQYRHPAEALALAAREGGLSSGYGWLANAQAQREAAAQMAAALAPFDPKAAFDARAAGGLFGANAPQMAALPDGRAAIKNSSGQTRQLNPLEAAAFAIAPDKAAWQQFGWQRDDVVRDAEQKNALERTKFAGDVNLYNSLVAGNNNTQNQMKLNEQQQGFTLRQMKVRAGLEKEIYDAKTEKDFQMQIRKMEWLKQHGGKEAAGVTDSVLGQVFAKGLEIYGGDIDKAIAAMGTFGNKLSGQGTPPPAPKGDIVSDAVNRIMRGKNPPSANAPAANHAPSAGLPEGMMLGGLFGRYSMPDAKPTRAEQIQSLETAIAATQSALEKNRAIKNPNGTTKRLIAQQENLLKRLGYRLGSTKLMGDGVYQITHNPVSTIGNRLEELGNLFWGGNPDNGAVR